MSSPKAADSQLSGKDSSRLTFRFGVRTAPRDRNRLSTEAEMPAS